MSYTIESEPTISTTEYTVGLHPETNEIYCGPTNANNILLGNSQKRTIDVLLAVAQFLVRRKSDVTIKNSEGKPVYTLSVTVLEDK